LIHFIFLKIVVLLVDKEFFCGNSLQIKKMVVSLQRRFFYKNKEIL